MAVCLTSGDCTTTQKHLRSCYVTSTSGQRCPRCPHRKSLAVPNILLCRGCPALRTRDHLEEDWGHSPACIPGRVPPSPHHHQWNWAESSSSVHLSGVYNRIRRQDREVDKRLAKANSAFCRLYKIIWNNKHLKKGIKISIYQRCLRTILNIYWSNYVSNVEVFDQVEITSIEAMLLKL